MKLAGTGDIYGGSARAVLVRVSGREKNRVKSFQIMK